MGDSDWSELIDPADIAHRQRSIAIALYERHFSAIRTWTSVGQMAVITAVIAGFAALAPSLFVVGPLAVGLLIGSVVVVSGVATAIAKRGSLMSRAHRIVEPVETAATLVAGMALIGLSGSAISIWWFLPMSWTVMSGRTQLNGWYESAALLTAAGALATVFAWGSRPADTAGTLVIGLALWWALRGFTAAEVAYAKAAAEREALVAENERLRVDRERGRIARDLHDVVGNQLSSVVWEARAMREQLDPEARAHLESLIVLLRDGLSVLRRTVWQLKYPEMSLSDLEEVIRARVALVTGTRASLLVDSTGEQSVPGEVCAELVAIAQEVAANALEHGGATAIHLHLDGNEGVGLVECDDGSPIHEEAFAVATGGLAHMRQRALEVGGSLQLAEPSVCHSCSTKIAFSWRA